MAQTTAHDLLRQADRLGLTLLAGPAAAAPIVRVEVVPLTSVHALEAGTLAIIATDEIPPPYLVDVAVRQANALQLAGILFPSAITLTQTATVLAERGTVPVLSATRASAPDLAIVVDRVLSGGASETMTRAAFAIEQATAAASGSSDDILDAAAAALGVALHVREDAGVSWTDHDAVCIGEVPIGRLETDSDDPAAVVALPVIASLLSRSMQRQIRERFAPDQSRADLIVELVLADAARVDGFIAPAARLGLPLQLSHVVGWLRPMHRSDPDLAAPRSVAPALELFALRLVESRPEQWHVAFVQDDMIIVSTEDHGAGDHQRRLREIGARIQEYATTLSGDDWAYTLGLGTPQTGPVGLRQSAAEARVAADSAIAAGRLGGVELTDVTGLRRVLLDFYASPTSRNLLQDVLRPLDALGAERSVTAVRTLSAYLSHRNSLVHAGAELNLHANAVGYRMKWIREALDVDLDDPDTRFAVELACRVRMLGA